MDDLLRKAVQSGSVADIVAAVQRGADVNARDDGGETALTYAMGPELGPERAKECVRSLLSLGARVAEERPRGGLGTSVHQAAAYGYTEALKELLSADGSAALNTFDGISRTPLMCAVQNGHALEASLLLDAGSDPDSHDSEMAGNTALIIAVQEKNLAMVQLLLKHGADPTIPGWVNRSALDRARDWIAAPAASVLRQIFELLDAEARRRTAATKRPQ